MYLWIVNKKVNLIKLLKYLFWFLVLYQTVVIVFFLFPITKPLMGSRHLNGTFPEKGSYSAFIVMYSLLLLFANEYYKIFSKRKAFLLFGLLIISLVFSYGARGFVFLLVYLFFKFILVSRNLKEKLAIILVTISFLFFFSSGILLPSLKGLKFKQIKKFLPFLFAFLAYCSVDIITFYQVWNLLFLSLAILALYKEEILHRDKSRQLTYAAI